MSTPPTNTIPFPITETSTRTFLADNPLICVSIPCPLSIVLLVLAQETTWTNTKKTTDLDRWSSSMISRRRPTLPGSFPPSTISAGGLNFRVRDGNGWIPSAMVTGNLLGFADPALRPGLRALKTEQWCFALRLVSRRMRCWRSSPRPISTRQLKSSQTFHPGPINLVIFEGSYWLLPWECSS